MSGTNIIESNAAGGRDVTSGGRDGDADFQANQHVPTNRSNEIVVVDRIFKTISIFFCFFTLGLCSPLVGNTLVHLERFFDVSTATISVTFTVQAVGGLFGCMLCGFVFDRVNHELAFAIGNIIRGLATVAAPFIGGLVPFIVAMCVHQISMGFVDASCQSYCVGLWTGHRYRDPLLQAAHAVWSLGGTLGPLIVARFLVDLPQQQDQTYASTTDSWSTPLIIVDNSDCAYGKNVFSYGAGAGAGNQTSLSPWNLKSSLDQNTLQSLVPNVSSIANVRFAYVTIGSMVLAANLFFFVAYLRGRLAHAPDRCSAESTTPPFQHPKVSGNTRSTPAKVGLQAAELRSCPESCPENAATSGQLDRLFYWIFMALTFFLCHLYPYSETIPVSYMTTFTVKYLNFQIQDASLLMSLFYGFQFAGRTLGVPVAAFLRPRTMLIINLAMTAASFVLLLAFVSVWPNIIWISAPLASFSMATTLATTILWIGDRIPMSGRMASILLVEFTSGGIVGPLVVSQLFERSTPMWFVYIISISSVTHFLLLMLFVAFDARFGDRVTRYATSGGLHGNDDVGMASMNGDRCVDKGVSR